MADSRSIVVNSLLISSSVLQYGRKDSAFIWISIPSTAGGNTSTQNTTKRQSFVCQMVGALSIPKSQIFWVLSSVFGLLGGVLSSGLAGFGGDEAVDEVARGQNQDSGEDIEAGHEAFGWQIESHHLNVAGRP